MNPLHQNVSRESILIDWRNMEQYSSIPIGYRLVDQAIVIPGKEAFGRKAVSSLDWFFKVHFPGNPIMPGVFIMEVMQQTGMLIVTTMRESKTDILLFHSCESVRMYRGVRPGDMLSSHVVLESFRHGVAKFNGKVTICDTEKGEEKTVCTMKFVLISEKDIEKIHRA